MSLLRALTTRTRKQPTDIEINNSVVSRAASQRNGRPVFRNQISSPVALVSTTNMLSYEAPDIDGTRPIGYRDFSSASSSSSNSGEDSDASSNSVHSNDTVTDMSSIGGDSPTSPEPNHLSCYFKPSVETSSPGQSPHLSVASSFDAPILPQRALSHSKRAHEALSRKRSVQRMQSPPGSARTSTEIFTPSLDSCVEAPTSSPFGNELAQLDEVAEEFGNTVCGVQADADTDFMRSNNLAVYGASDYLSEIHSLIYNAFADEPEIAAWF